MFPSHDQKRDRALEYLQAHPRATTVTLMKAVGVSSNTARRYIKNFKAGLPLQHRAGKKPMPIPDLKPANDCESQSQSLVPFIMGIALGALSTLSVLLLEKLL